MNENEKDSHWLNKQVRIELLKDGRRLVYTALILAIDAHSVTFKDRDGEVFAFNRSLIQEMQLLKSRGGSDDF